MDNRRPPAPPPSAQKLPEPPPIKSNSIFAGQLRNCIERGMKPELLADLALPAQGPAFVYGASVTTVDQALETFRTDPDSWKHLAAVEDKLRTFLAGFIARCQTIVIEQKIAPPTPRPDTEEEKEAYRNA